MKKLVSLLLASLMTTAIGCTKTESASSCVSKRYKVAIVKQLDHASLDEIADAVCDELDAIAKENNIVIDYGNVYSGQNDQTVLQQIGSQVIADDVDCVIPIATLAAQTMTVASDGSVPVVYAAISDPDAADLTGMDYVTGTSDALNTKQILDMMLQVNPEMKTVGLLYSKSEANSQKAIREAKEYLTSKKISFIEATGNTDDEIRQAAATLIGKKADAVFTPTDNVVMAAELSIAPELADAGIPHYTGADSFVRNGAFVTCGVNYTELGKETADMAFTTMSQGIAKTEYQGSYKVMDGGIVTVNQQTSEKLGIDPAVFETFGTVKCVGTSEK